MPSRKARQVGEGAYEVAPGLILQQPCDMLKRTVSASDSFLLENSCGTKVSNIETSLAPNFGATGKPQVARKQQSFTCLRFVRLPRGTPALYRTVACSRDLAIQTGATADPSCGLKIPSTSCCVGALIGKTQGKMQSARLNFMHRWILFDFAIANASNTRASSLGPVH